MHQRLPYYAHKSCDLQLLSGKAFLNPCTNSPKQAKGLNDFKTQSIGSCSKREYIPLFCSKKEAFFIMKLKTWFTAVNLQPGTLSMFLHIFAHPTFSAQCLEVKAFNFGLIILSHHIYEIPNSNSELKSGSDKNIILFPLEGLGYQRLLHMIL